MRIMIDRAAVIRALGRLAFFLFAWALVLFLLFLIGNYQRFLDQNQRLIMSLLSVTLVFELAVGACYFILLARTKGRVPRPSRLRIVLLWIALSFSFFLFIILEFFHAWV